VEQAVEREQCAFSVGREHLILMAPSLDLSDDQRFALMKVGSCTVPWMEEMAYMFALSVCNCICSRA